MSPNLILIAEDNEANRLLTITQLERLGYEAHAVADGAEAIEAVAANDYALVLMDCRMPGVDGLAAARAIREAERGTDEHTVIVAMTAGAQDHDRTACLNAGMDDYLCKPVLLGDLERMFAKWLGGGAAGPAPVAAGAEGDASPAAIAELHTVPPVAVGAAPSIDPKTFDRFSHQVGDDEFAEQFVQIYLRELDGRLEGIRRGREDGDGELLTRLAHTLKSTSATLGALPLAERCAALEAAGGDPSNPGVPGLIEDVRDESEAVRRALIAMGYEPRDAVA